jgi:hypothetical protein
VIELERLETQVLKRLALLAEGGTSTLDPNKVHESSSESKPPPGTDERNTGVLSQNVSLATYHRGLLLKAREKSMGARLAALAAAHLDLECQLKRPPAYISPDSSENAKDRDEAILRHEGQRPEYVATFEKCSASYVRKIRKRANRDQTWGGSLEGFEIEPAA